jgi:hypothetical protein
VRDSGLSIHFQDDNDRTANRTKEKPIEKPVKKEEKKEEKKKEKIPIKILYYKMQIIYIIVITCEVIAILLLSPIVLMGR